MKKYLCIGNGIVEAQWLPRWYKVPYGECAFINKNVHKEASSSLKDLYYGFIVLKPLPKGSNYKKHLKIIKTEHLLNGG